jgi:hypothetical protein
MEDTMQQWAHLMVRIEESGQQYVTWDRFDGWSFAGRNRAPRDLAELGRDGWELVNVGAWEVGVGTSERVATAAFTRPVQP